VCIIEAVQQHINLILCEF